METLQLFHTCTTFLLQNFVTFSHLPSEMKVIQLFKAKMEAFRDKNPQKVEMQNTILHLFFVFPLQMKITFLCPQAENLAQTNTFGHILLDHDFDAPV